MNNNNGGLDGGFVLFIVFLILKLTGVIAWSWVWVTAPIWIPFAALAVILVGIFLWVGLTDKNWYIK